MARDRGQARAVWLRPVGVEGEATVSLADDALAVIDQGIREHYPSQLYALFSGGDDSLTSTCLAARHPRFSGCIHLDTGTGVPETRAFVEDTCHRYGWPLEVYSPPAGEYERLVLDERYARLQADAQALGLEDWQWAGGPTQTRRFSARLNPKQPLCTSCQLSFVWGES